jgi:hypothetical protein
MLLATARNISCLVLLFLPAEYFSESTSQAKENPNFMSAEMSLQEFGRRLVPWESKHPELFSKDTTQAPVPQGQSIRLIYRISYPTLDIYSAAGVPFYYSDSSDVNVKVIDALPRVIPEPDLDPRYKARPSLREALSMIPGIPRSDWATPAQIDYTIVAVILDRTGANPSQPEDASVSHAKKNVTYVPDMDGSGREIRVIQVPGPPDPPDVAKKKALARAANALANQAQDEAIQRLKTRLNGSRIRVIEVHLMEP